MKSLGIVLKTVAAIFAFSVLTACGGGGGNGGGNREPGHDEVSDDGSISPASLIVVHEPGLSSSLASEQSDFYFFDGVIGERYLLTLISNTGDPDFGVFNSNILSDNSILLYSLQNSGKQEIEFKATVNQRYYIEVFGGFSQSNYELRIERSPRQLANGVTYPTNNKPAYEIITGDLNGDNLSDVAIMTRPGIYVGQEIIIYYQTSTGTLGNPFTIDKMDIASVDDFKGIAIGDFNSDGLNDLSVLTKNSTFPNPTSVLIYQQNDSTHALDPYVEYELPGSYGSDISVGDVNNDDRDDVLVLSGSSLHILEQNQPGTLNSYYTNSLVNADFDNQNYIKTMDLGNDNDTDLVFRTGGLSFATLTQEPPSGLTVSNIYSITADYWPSFDAFDTGDVNNDGLDDIVAIDPAGSNARLNIYHQDSSGSLTKSVTQQPFSTIPCGLKVEDITGDGIDDLIGDNIISGRIQVARHIPGIGYTESDTYTAFQSSTIGGCSYMKIFDVADLNNDGYLDVVAGDLDIPNSTGISVLLSIENTQKGSTL